MPFQKVTTIDAKRRIVVAPELMREFGWKVGDTIVIRWWHGGAVVELRRVEKWPEDMKQESVGI